MKKVLSLLLACVMIISFCAPVLAVDGCDCGKTPVVMISGFGATTLVRVNDDGSREAVFPPSMDRILTIVKNNISKFDPNNIIDFVYAIIGDVLDPIRMNPDGTSYYNIEPVYSSVEDTSYKGFVKNDATALIPYGDSDFLDMKSAAERLGDDHVFNFLFDWRKSGDEVADELLSYIEDVRSFTGHDKVSVYCLSQGSVPVAQYLYKYADKGYIENMLFDNPIFDGSEFVSEILGGDKDMNLNIDEIIDLLESIIHIEINLSDILNVLPSDKIDPFANKQVKLAKEAVILPIAKCAPAYLEMAPVEEYQRIIDTYYSDEGNEILVAEADKVMNGYRSNIEGTLRNAIKCGADVSIVSCSGFGLVTGGTTQSDAIVDLASSCGAFTSPIGEPFDTSYVQKKNIGKYCISPDRTIDLSCGYIPEKTWVINERYHGQGEWAPNSLALIEELLYTHNLTDAWCSNQFPQFMQSDDPCADVYVSFAETNSLISPVGGSGELIVRNTSNQFPEIITSVKCGDKAISRLPAVLLPGEEIIISADTTENTSGYITVKYVSLDLPTEKSKTFGYTVTDSFSGKLADEAKTEKSIIESVTDSIRNIVMIIKGFVETIKTFFG